jgi:choline dehydrogenase-like flavoprotein
MSRSTGDYDYIIVGAGTAGCVLARRLIDQTSARILLVEAGPVYRGVLHNPPLPGIRFGRKFSWEQKSIPQPRLYKRQIEWPMGKVVGGSSSVNAMIGYLGHPGNYDAWAQAGNPGWSFQDLAPYFQKALGVQPGTRSVDTTQGMISLSQPRHHSAFSEAFLEACCQDSMALQTPLLGLEPEHCGYFPVMQRDGERFQSARGYLLPILREPRLTVLTSTQVLQVLFSGNRAIGIEVVEHGSTKKQYASTGIILCGGVFQTPRILQSSGLGPHDVLQAAGIPTRIHLPAIGANFHDHLRFEMIFRSNRVSPGSKRLWIQGALNYLLQRRGVMVSNCCESGAFLRSDSSVSIPDLQLITHFQTFGPKRHVAIEVCLVASHSRGTVTLNPSDPYGPPCVDPHSLDDPRDLQAILKGIQRVRTIVNQPALRNFPILDEVRPGSHLQASEELAESICRRVTTAYHPGGTCAMGSNGALDHNLRVRGTQSLWVADASAMPLVPFGNSTCPVLVLAEKASDMILATSR